MKNRKIIGIMACDPQGVIGNKGQIPWSYSKEFEYFYQTVKNNIIVMGRKTFDSIPAKILKNCICIVFSRNTPLQSYNNRHLSKPTYREEFKGYTERSTAAYIDNRTDASTGLTSKLPLEAKFGKMSIIFFIKSLDDFWQIIKPFTDKKIFMVGGTEIATLFLEQNLIDEFLLTKINKNYDGDTFIPLNLLAEWHSVIIDKTNNYQIYKFTKRR
nr:FolA [Rickettsia endosymbiont of Ixodes pacificus]